VPEVQSQILKNIFNVESTACGGESRGSKILLFKLESGSEKEACKKGDEMNVLSSGAR
jgi:hypothetical protein